MAYEMGPELEQDTPETQHKKKKKKSRHFIQEAIRKPGALHEDLGVPKGQKIPTGAIQAAAQGGGKVAQRARFALTLAKMRKG